MSEFATAELESRWERQAYLDGLRYGTAEPPPMLWCEQCGDTVPIAKAFKVWPRRDGPAGGFCTKECLDKHREEYEIWAST
jgi:hypothetical protein